MIVYDDFEYMISKMMPLEGLSQEDKVDLLAFIAQGKLVFIMRGV